MGRMRGEDGDTAGGAPGDDALAARVARAYYLQDESKVAIAEQFGLSRFQVARLLKHARQSGIVRIEVRSPDGLDEELGGQVAAFLGIASAHVLDGPAERGDLAALGSVLARVVSGTVREGDIVGLTWSHALVAMSQSLESLAPCTAVQLAGQSVSPVALPDSAEIVRRTAEASGGTAVPLPSPLLLTDSSAASSLLRQPQIASTMEYFERLDAAVVSVGAWHPGESTVYDAAAPHDRARATQHGAVGEICGRLFDVEGRAVDEVLGDRIVGIQLEQLVRTPNVIGTSFGAIRVAATIAAARGGLIDALVIDRPLAEGILALA